MRTRIQNRVFNTNVRTGVALIAILWLCATCVRSSAAQESKESAANSPSPFRMGEKLSYNVSFDRLLNAAYLEMAVVSRGSLSGQDVVELHSAMKTLGIVSAAFFQFDEDRTVFASPQTGLPVYVLKNIKVGVEPKEVVDNFLKEPSPGFDLLSLIYKARVAGGAGSFPLSENLQNFTVTFVPTTSEKFKSEAGEFDTVVSLVQSEYLTANGIKELKINFSTDENHVPVLFRIKTSRGIFRAAISAVQMPKPVGTASPVPSKAPTPDVVVTAKPTPAPYVENQPLSSELGFAIGEKLDYSITDSGKPIATMSLSAKERKLFQNEDSLLLTATITGIEQGNTIFNLGDSIQVQVDPETLAPRWMEARFMRELSWLNQTIAVDKRTGNIMFGKEKPIDAPIGTHTLLSLLYAMRSFNLKPSKDSTNPVNDTRVAVFWESQPYIFTLIPSNPEEITVNGEKVSAQLISFKTGNESLDKRPIKVWLSANERVPVRFSVGTYQADLTAPSKNLPK